MKTPTRKTPKIYRPGKTREDRMPTGDRPRVAAAQQRREAMQRRAAQGAD